MIFIDIKKKKNCGSQKLSLDVSVNNFYYFYQIFYKFGYKHSDHLLYFIIINGQFQSSINHSVT